MSGERYRLSWASSFFLNMNGFAYSNRIFFFRVDWHGKQFTLYRIIAVMKGCGLTKGDKGNNKITEQNVNVYKVFFLSIFQLLFF
jgi:hypothetical protein